MIITDLSVSRIKVTDKCMRAYRHTYIDRLPAPQERASKIFGTVVHNGIEHWYEGDYQHERLATFVDAEWWKELPQEVAVALRHCIAAERGLNELEQLVRISRPEIRGARQTKDFMSSQQFKQFNDARDELMAATARCEEMAWPKDENAFQAYMKSVTIADQLEARWKIRPRPLMVEREFLIEFAGLNIKGRIDQIRADPNPEGEVKIEGLDVKTGRQMMTQMEAFIQAFLYDRACLEDPTLPEPDYWTFWMARHNKPQHGIIDRERHAKLAESILKSVKRRIEEEDWAPQFGMWCKSCDFAPLCEAEIGIWPVGQESLTLDLIAAAAA